MNRAIDITFKDRDRILKLIEKEKEFGTEKNKGYLKDLEQELKRANIVSSEDIPPNSITMNSKIILKDLDLGEETTYTLVYPGEADLSENKISVLAPIGTAILGFREGDEIDWKVPAGIVKLEVKKIIYQPEAAGNYEL
ncbi:nucleoside diphosphate kinase regulator [Desulfosporosinus meridiei]|uniref:Transcription elongation factor n=1 Tax=Desulfosporosinus meridiei (strain ATCC BAA-275 / DSM 13257 / KCTC 12902 / NCIMB 13706 / S10) TaxID=768704 RepID=J7IVI7_DESMD|nr:nucleoside diphosphate kinase regulator [Desulfosporosinus meridiei]AFQ45807.1 transcription elongation factor [Desulfosporosinus meridiei DSM 13257]